MTRRVSRKASCAKANDIRVAAIEAKGYGDLLLEEKVDKANREISELQKEIDELNISTATVYRMIQTGKLEATKLRGKESATDTAISA